MSEPIKHGDMLPIIGGPLDGDKKAAVILSGADSANSSFIGKAESGVFYRYRLDPVRRAWVFDTARRPGK